jgi:DNA-binding MarR family transcriptional regulator
MAGELVDRTSLTTGAITGVIDRLERAELVRHERDPHDRRCIVLELIHNSGDDTRVSDYGHGSTGSRND